jgi:hypothetical protein
MESLIIPFIETKRLLSLSVPIVLIVPNVPKIFSVGTIRTLGTIGTEGQIIFNQLSIINSKFKNSVIKIK